MPRKLKLAAAQVGAVHKDSPREETLNRLLALLDEAYAKGVQLLVYPELTFTTFFPRHLLTPEELAPYFEPQADITTSSQTAPLFDKATEYGIDIAVGYAERDPSTENGYNTSIYFSSSQRRIISKYRKIHLPGTVEPFADPTATNQLEKRYFTPGDLGFTAFRAPSLLDPSTTNPPILKSSSPSAPTSGPIADKQDQSKGDPILGMLICNDRRWPESWRALALQGAELILCGYNTGANMPALWGTTTATANLTPEQAEAKALFHSRLVQQANSYMNACFSVTAARCGLDDGKYGLIAGSAIVSPEGYVVAEAKGTGDEIVYAEVDLEDCQAGKGKTFDFERHRRVEHYGLIGSQTGVVEPPLLE